MMKRRVGGGSEAARLLDAAAEGNHVISVGTVYVNGHEPGDAFKYRLTEKRFVWNRAADPYICGFALGEVSAFGSWEDHRGHLIVGVDVDGTLWDLILLPETGHKADVAARQQELIVRFLMHALRDAGGRQLAHQG
jgi:hypothetical protein